MSTTQLGSERATASPNSRKVDMKLEVVVIPVSDVDRAKHFYLNMGWRLDADFASGDTWRIVQMTPPGSACSFFIGKGLTKATPGSVPGLLVMVDDIEAARAELIGYGVAVSEVFHFAVGLHFTGPQGRTSGPDPERRSYRTLGEFLQAAERWINFYNQYRPHEGLRQQSPDQYAKDHGLPTAPYLPLL